MDGLFTRAVEEVVTRTAPRRTGISFELRSAWSLPSASEPPSWLGRAEQRVFNWLAVHRNSIVAAEWRWHIDRRAIAGAIAWEALQNINYFTPALIGCGRSSGPGKVHYRANRLFGEGDPVARQIEVAGYLPRRSMVDRKRHLREPAGAIEYIGATMCAYADIGSDCGFEDLRCRNDLILTQPYQGVRRIGRLNELDSWRAALVRHRARGTELAPDNPMYHWVNEPHTSEFLEAVVGCCDASISTPAYLGPGCADDRKRDGRAGCV
jgi:hypothetical protein